MKASHGALSKTEDGALQAGGTAGLGGFDMMYTAKTGIDFGGAFPAVANKEARIGVIDVGSNSIRMVVFDGAARSPAVFFNEKVFAGLGAGLSETRKLSPAGRERALAALARFKAVADGIDDLQALDVVATAAVREAEDGPDFIEQVARETGLRIRVASGADEARLAAQGVLVGEPRADGVVADIGGASMELVDVADGVVGQGVTTPLGPLKLAGLKGGELVKTIDKALDAALKGEKGKPRFGEDRTLFIVGGSFRALVRAHMAATDYPLRVLQGFSLDAEDAAAMAEWGAGLSAERYAELAGSSEGRAAVAPLGALVLSRLIKKLRPRRLALSNFGLREGVLLEHLPRELRLQDPLLQPCETMEVKSARRPGFGLELWRWLAPAMAGFDAKQTRLAQAACLLSDVTWRTQAEFRAQSDFELVTRNNFGSIDHEAASSSASRCCISTKTAGRRRSGGRRRGCWTGRRAAARAPWAGAFGWARFWARPPRRC